MVQILQPLREEHQELFPHIKHMQTVADAIGTAPLTSLQQEIDEITAFLVHQLLPHAQAEERVLYPIVDEIVGAPGVTATMSQDHLAIGQLTEELKSLQGASLQTSQQQALRRVLYGLLTLVTVHMAKEEEVYLPLLEAHLTEDTARRLFEDMERAARDAKLAVAK